MLKNVLLSVIKEHSRASTTALNFLINRVSFLVFDDLLVYSGFNHK